MRLLFASLAAVTAVAFAAPSFAQDTPSSTPAPTPITKPAKHRTSSTGCSALKGQSAKEYCLKQQRAHAHVTKPHKASKKVASKSAPATVPGDTAPVTQSAPSPSQSQSVAVPPLPQKTL
jgi:hypothetical protein